MQRIFQLAGVHNYRDLGGLEAQNGQTAFGRVIRGESPHHLTPESLEQLRGMGLSTVIDLRSDSERKENPNPFAEYADMSYQHIPLFAVLQSMAAKNSSSTPPSLEVIYIAALELCQDAFRESLTAIAQAEGLVLLHCVAGKDRTGLIAMLLLGLAGASHTAIIKDYAQTADATALLEHLRLESIKNGREIQSNLLEAKPETMKAVLNYLEQKHGGIRGYVQNSLKLESGILALLIPDYFETKSIV